MTADEVLHEIAPLGKESYKKVLLNHGVPEPVHGVKIEDMKNRIVKRVKKDYQLALDLYDTGVYDAMYLAGLLADEKRMTRADLQHWLDGATCNMLREYTVPWVAAESAHAYDVARAWIDDADPDVVVAGWATWSGLMVLDTDTPPALAEVKKLLQRVQKTIHEQANRVKYVMNNFVIAAGAGVAEVTELALKIGAKVGMVEVDVGDTSCQIPFAPDYIRKVQERGTIGKKRKTVRC